MLQLIYRSEAVEGTDLHTVKAIADCASRKNRNLEITGVLLFTGDHFVQVLEGGKHVVLRVYEQIQQDTRHRNVDLLLLRPIEKRRFPYWSMQLAMSDASRLPPPIGSATSPNLLDVSSDSICSTIAQEFSRARNTSLMRHEARCAG